MLLPSIIALPWRGDNVTNVTYFATMLNGERRQRDNDNRGGGGKTMHWRRDVFIRRHVSRHFWNAMVKQCVAPTNGKTWQRLRAMMVTCFNVAQCSSAVCRTLINQTVTIIAAPNMY